MKYCGMCPYLKPKEYEQTEEKENHICTKYNKRVLHAGHHPRLLRLNICLRSKERKEYETVNNNF